VADNKEQAELRCADGELDADTIIADSDRLRQLLENLFRNAIKHGGEEVTITIGTENERFYVEDDGPGISPDERDDVFDAGYTTANDGTGLGLSIVQRIVAAHDWEVCVTEGSAGGARFVITGVEFV
jgi:signal transduction histidine kinase